MQEVPLSTRLLFLDSPKKRIVVSWYVLFLEAHLKYKTHLYIAGNYILKTAFPNPFLMSNCKQQEFAVAIV